MDKRLDRYADMLFESAQEVFKIVKNPQLTDENKVLIMSVNALTTTTKTAIQNEMLKYKMGKSNGTLLKLSEKVDD